MAFDDQTRRRLLKMVTACRSLLTGDFDEQLRSHYGIYAKEGRVFDIEKLTALDDTERETARLLRERIDHLAGGKGAEAISEAVGRILREQAFTVMNRFAAIRMAEERKIIKQSVGGGLQSNGFRVFEQAAGVGSAALGSQYERYLVYLDCLFDELSLDLGVLFDRSDALGLLFPTENAVRELFEELNHLDIAELWPLDETIGWIYQYWNSKEERKAMRDASAAPRNSRELAVRNQFFTPRYVVEFLTDNTLGRIWYEMTKGETRLADQCRYLVRRPCELFLGGPDTLYWHDAPGAAEFHEFDRTGDPAHLPENPTIGVALGWAESLRRGDIERALARVGLDHEAVMDRVVEPLQVGKVPEDLGTVNPALLIQALWHLQEQYQRQGEPVPFKEPAEKNPAVSGIWKALRDQLQNPPEDLSQEELLKRPVFVPHRPIKDPREIRLLDPACGSMHFGLYAFDLFETIYEEAWARNLLPETDFGGATPPFPHDTVRKKEGMDEVHSYAGGGPCDAAKARIVILQRPDSGDGLFHTGPYVAPPEYTFRTEIDREMPWVEFDYQEALASGWISEEEGERLVRETDAFEHARIDPLPPEEIEVLFRREVPKLIIEHNIHGVDIDPRAVQIAGLSLWLRAQKSWSDIPVSERPHVRRSNIVCAEPMPGSEAMLEDFVQTLDPPLLGELVKTVFDQMQLAGEAGTLLKIEEEIRTAIDDAKAKWEKLGAADRDLFSAEELNQTLRPGTQQELTGVEKVLTTDHRPLATDFFDTAEERIYAALRDYAESAEAGDYQRRLFAEDAAHGFAFIDLCRKRYDAVVMNPPFGEWSAQFKTVGKKAYPDSYNDILAAFVDRGGQLLHRKGRLGAITSRTCFFLTSFTKWRENVALSALDARLLVDLGHGVMDAAMVEAAAYVLEKPAPVPTRSPLISIGLLHDVEKAGILEPTIAQLARGALSTKVFTALPDSFRKIPTSPFAYWVSERIKDVFVDYPTLNQGERTARQGLSTANDFRFVRSWWELPSRHSQDAWVPYAKGGSYSPFYCDIDLVVNWESNGEECKQYIIQQYPYLDGKAEFVAKNPEFYFKKGITWPRRTKHFCPRTLPEGAIFSDGGQAVFNEDKELATVALLFSAITQHLISLSLGTSSASSGGSPQYMTGTVAKIPFNLPADTEAALSTLAEEAWRQIRDEDTTNLLSHVFISPIPGPLKEASSAASNVALAVAHRIREEQLQNSRVVLEKRIEQIDEITFDLYKIGQDESLSIREARRDRSSIDANIDLGVTTGDLADYLMGCSLGRWDIRYATGERQPPELPDPFHPLPVCPPGMLQNADGLPAAPADVPEDYPMGITWSGILVDEENHPDDIVGRVREALQVIWKDRADAIEQEACEILKVKDKPRENLDALRVYFRDPNKFFKDHLSRYSKSRRKAPIYWPLSTESGSFTLWIYYHRLDSQTLYTCIEIVEKKREDLGKTIQALRSKIGTEGSAEERQKLEDLIEFQSELKTFQERLLEVASLPYRPNLNDGVQITAAPLWQLFRHKPWRTVLKKTWEELKKGKYDWAHLAMSIWPDRVAPLCTKDRSLAIAHGIEDLFWVPDLESKKDQLRPLKSPEEEIKLLRKADFSVKDIEAAEDDVELAAKIGVRDHLWIEQPEGNWRRRLGPKEEIENEIKLRRGI